MIRVIKSEILKFEKNLTKNLLILNLGILLIGFLPYYFGSDGYFSIFKSLTSLGMLWNGLAGVQKIGLLQVIILAIVPFLFFISLFFLFQKTSKYEGPVIYQLFTRPQLEESPTFQRSFIVYIFSTLFYFFVLIFQIITLIFLTFSPSLRERSELYPSYGFYLILLFMILIGYLFVRDIIKKFEFKRIKNAIINDAINEIEKKVQEFLNKSGIIYFINIIITLQEKWGISIEELEPIYNLNEPLHFKETSEIHIIEEVKLEKVKPKIQITHDYDGRLFEGERLMEVPLTAARVFVLEVANTGEGNLFLEVNSNKKWLYPNPAQVIIPSQSGKHQIEIGFEPRLDETLKRGSISEADLIFSYPYNHIKKSKKFKVKLTIEGYSSKVATNPVIAGILGFVLSIIGINLLDKIPLIKESFNNSSGLSASAFWIMIIGTTMLSWRFSKSFFVNNPTRNRALFTIPLTVFIVIQLVFYAIKSINPGFLSADEAQQIQNATGFINAKKGLSVRVEPSLVSKKVVVLKFGEKVLILSNTNDSEWVKVGYGNSFENSGYVMNRYVTVDGVVIKQ